jgi:signal transduction histidine kinase
VRVGLVGRMLIASGLLVLVVGAALAVLLPAVAQLGDSQRRAQQSEQTLVVANRLERLVVDMETGQRGFLLTQQEKSLQPWQVARASFGGQATLLAGLVADNPEQQVRARQIAAAGTSYIRDYSVPLVQAAREDPGGVRRVAATEEGTGRVNAIRAEFDEFIAAEERLAAVRQRQADAAANRAIVATGVGLVGSVVLIGLFTAYLTRAIVQPVRRAAAMAGRVAGGDLEARLRERGAGEIGVLQHSFNTMVRSLRRAHDELAASRARIVSAADHARRRIERDLHDGTQQRLVSLLLDVRAAESGVPADQPGLRTQLAGIADGLAGAFDELREISRGIHPTILSEGGLAPAVKALARRATVPVELDVDLPGRLPEPVEVCAYYVVSEALANTAKYAHASYVEVHAGVDDGRLRLSIHDDGIGGADPHTGSGLIGLADRLHALGGTMAIDSPSGHGTTLTVDVPVTAR